MTLKLLIYKCVTFVFGKRNYTKFKDVFLNVRSAGGDKLRKLAVLMRDLLRMLRIVSPAYASAAFYNSLSAKGKFTGLETSESPSPPASSGLTIITLNLNSDKFLSEYLSGFDALPSMPIQLIFVDHNSVDRSVDVLQKFEFSPNIEVKLVAKDSNDTFSKSNNDALALAKYDFILFLNNDVVIQPQSDLLNAIDILHNNSEVGVVGWELYHDKNAKIQKY